MATMAGAGKETAPSGPQNRPRASGAAASSRSSWASEIISSSVQARTSVVTQAASDGNRATRPRLDPHLVEGPGDQVAQRPLGADPERRQQRLGRLVPGDPADQGDEGVVARAGAHLGPGGEHGRPARPQHPAHLRDAPARGRRRTWPRTGTAPGRRCRSRSAAAPRPPRPTSTSGAVRRATASIPSFGSTPTTSPSGPTRPGGAREDAGPAADVEHRVTRGRTSAASSRRGRATARTTPARRTSS